jgi:hypothetical protein
MNLEHCSNTLATLSAGAAAVSVVGAGAAVSVVGAGAATTGVAATVSVFLAFDDLVVVVVVDVCFVLAIIHYIDISF